MFSARNFRYFVMGAILLTAALALTTADSTAQTTKLTVTDVKALQVIEDVPLVVGKPTVVKVVLTAGGRTPAKLTGSLGASAKVSTARLGRGNNTLTGPLVPPSAAR